MAEAENIENECVRLTLPVPAGAEEILTADAMAFVRDLVRTFQSRVDALRERRLRLQRARDKGERLTFRDDTKDVRDGAWKVAPLPPVLRRRRVEITGPVDAKMIINALNSGADVFMADLEDSTTPTFANVMLGQAHLRQAVRGTLRHVDDARGKVYAIGASPAVLMVRPRGWHLDEAHVIVDKRRAPASLIDFGLYFFHNARALVDAERGPFFYLPKLEGALEARLWADVFKHAELALGLPRGVTKATVLIETLPAAFELDEILFELRAHAAGLNCGRWDYIFSFIKVHRADDDCVLPDRAQITMTQPFMRAYTQLVVKTCHRRGAMAIGGMAAQIPIRGNDAANTIAFEKVRADKTREANDGHDGTWVAHPGLVPVAMDVFRKKLEGRDNQLDIMRDDVIADGSQLLAVPTGTRTEEGLRQNLRIGVGYLAAWLDGAGCVPLENLMEDAATAEISRSQVWQWLHRGAALEDGRVVDGALIDSLLDAEEGIKQALSPSQQERWNHARTLFRAQLDEAVLPEFLTLAAYDAVVKDGR